jgi:protein HIRA/HIR1
LSSRGLIATIENGINEQGHPSPPGLGEQEGGGGGEEKEWWEQAMTLSHLETRMLACLVLETTGQEYKMFLGLYAKKLGEEGFRSKAEELVRELAGKMVVG